MTSSSRSSWPLNRPVQDALLAVAKLLADYGPQLGRPYADTLNGSEYANMKELRFEAWMVSGVRPLHSTRIGRRFCWSPGDKSGGSQKRFYKRLIAKADKRLSAHLESLKARKKEK